MISAPSINYGKCHEEIAKRKYASIKKVHIHDCGFVVNAEYPFLGASPDAKVCDNGELGLLEVKCPYSCRYKTVKQASLTLKHLGLRYNETLNKFDLLPESLYMNQIQGQLLITGAAWCDLAVFTQVDMVIIRVYPDRNKFSTILAKLCRFYSTYCMPYLSPETIVSVLID